MFDFAWSEIALIAVVALIAIGPKDMPAAIKTMTDFIKKARRMAAEFQTHVDDLVREADLQDVRDQIKDLRSFDIKGQIAKTLDADGSIRDAFSDPLSEHKISETVTHEFDTADEFAAGISDDEASPGIPDFIPPGTRREEPPAFIPPGTHRY